MFGYESGMDFESDVDLTLTAPIIYDLRRAGTPHEWDAYVRGNLTVLSELNAYAGSATVTSFDPDEAERLGRRLIAAAAAARVASQES